MTAYEWRISDWSSDVCSSDLRSQVQHFHEGLRHALGPVLLPQLFGGDALDMLQVRIRPGRGDQLHADRRAVGNAEGHEQKTARRGDVRQFGEEATGLLGDVRRTDFPGTAEIGRASCRERVGQYVSISVGAGS